MTPPDASNFTRASVDPILVARVREIMIEYAMLHGDPPSLVWLLRELQLR